MLGSTADVSFLDLRDSSPPALLQIHTAKNDTEISYNIYFSVWVTTEDRVKAATTVDLGRSAVIKSAQAARNAQRGAGPALGIGTHYL